MFERPENILAVPGDGEKEEGQGTITVTAVRRIVQNSPSIGRHEGRTRVLTFFVPCVIFLQRERLACEIGEQRGRR